MCWKGNPKSQKLSPLWNMAGNPGNVSRHLKDHAITYIHIYGINLYHSLGIFSRRRIDDIFRNFPRKHDMTFHANCLGKNKKNISKCRLLKILPRVLSVKYIMMNECLAHLILRTVYLCINP